MHGWGCLESDANLAPGENLWAALPCLCISLSLHFPCILVDLQWFRIACGASPKCTLGAAVCSKTMIIARGLRLAKGTSSRSAPNLVSFERACQVIVLLIGAHCAYSGRNLPLGVDGVEYLDVARAYLRHDWHVAVNGYWGPLYSWLLAIGMWVSHPRIRTEYAVARAVSFGVFAASLFAFSMYWRAVADWSRRTSDQTPVPDASPFLWTALGYLLFITKFAWYVDVVSPDILVATIVLVVAAFLFKLNDRQQRGISNYAWLGVLLAIGFYAKAILLYFAVFVLTALVIQGFRSGNLQRPMAAIIVFVVLVSPFVVILSRTLGHFSAGDSGKLAYAWCVDGSETKTWLTDHGAPMPFYPGSIVLDSPRVFRLPSIYGVTYAPWYDAARFDKRSHPSVNLRGQLRRLAINLRSLEEQIREGSALLVPLLILVWYSPNASLRHLAATWFCTLPAVGVVGMYLLVYLVSRYMFGFSLLLWGAALAAVVVPPELRLLARRAMLAGTLVFAGFVMPGLLHYVVSQRTESVERDMAVAEALSQYGITPGMAVASIGDGEVAYWAQLARVSVVAEVWSIDSVQLWSRPEEIQQAVLRSMADSGAKAVVWLKDSDQSCPPDWLSLPEHSGCMILPH
jgi:hypothetical protein